ncbi:Uncharacterised protein [Shigella sonnei]|nr:Uncharacterised protein [Shigella sonnei]
MRPSIIFATAEYVKRLREECLRENKPLHRHTRFRRQELAQDEINPDVLAMSGAAWRHPVVRPDSDRQLLAHPPVSAEPAGAVSGCRYGPMSEKPGLQRPFRSRRLCRAVTCAPCTPDGV